MTGISNEYKYLYDRMKEPNTKAGPGPIIRKPLIPDYKDVTKNCYCTTVELTPLVYNANAKEALSNAKEALSNHLAKELSSMELLCDSHGLWYREAKKNMALIKKVIFNPPATIVIWKDGKKTVVKAHNEEFDPEKGLAMCIAERYFGNYSRFKKVIEENLEADNA